MLCYPYYHFNTFCLMLYPFISMYLRCYYLLLKLLFLFTSVCFKSITIYFINKFLILKIFNCFAIKWMSINSIIFFVFSNCLTVSDIRNNESTLLYLYCAQERNILILSIYYFLDFQHQVVIW
jgi:hypothetical protein